MRISGNQPSSVILRQTKRFQKKNFKKTYPFRKNIVYLQFCNWYHLDTRWFIQKKKCIMSYMLMTIYNIYSIFYLLLFILSAS